MKRALVLDFGGVITRSLFETHATTEAALGLPPGTLTWRGPFDPSSDALWCDMQAGKLSERDYWQQRSREVGALLGETWDRMETFVLRARGAEPEAMIRPEAVAAIRTVKAAGLPVAVLSNELDLFYGKELRQRVAVLHEVDAIIDGTYTHLLKPDPRAYALCLEALQLPATACVFLDDQQRNVDGARQAGMVALTFDVLQPAESFARALHALGITG